MNMEKRYTVVCAAYHQFQYANQKCILSMSGWPVILFQRERKGFSVPATPIYGYLTWKVGGALTAMFLSLWALAACPLLKEKQYVEVP